MAQGDNIQISSHTANNQTVQNSSRFKAPKAKKSPTFQQLLQCDDSKWSQISSQVMKKNHGQEDEANRHNKKSVLTKVKDKAKKWKISLSRKMHSEKNESQCPVTRSCGVGPNDKREEDAEYHSARMVEFKKTPATNTQSVASISGNHLEKLNTKENKDEHESSSNTTESHSKTHEPSDSSVATADDTDSKNQTSTTMDVPKAHEFPETNSRFSGLKVSTSDNSQNKFNKSFEEGETTCKSESHTPDKGAWMKEYLLHKFEPSEDERALSKVITQAISPRRDKMREAMTSFLRNDESSNADNSVSLNLKSKSLPAASTNLNTNNTPIKQSHSLGSSASKASMNLNQTFKSTFASYQDHFLSSSSKCNTNVINSPTIKTSSSPLGHGSSGNETKASAQDDVSNSVKKSQVPSHTATSVRRVPISRAKQTQDPSHSNETNTIQVRPSTRTDYNASNSNSSIAR